MFSIGLGVTNNEEVVEPAHGDLNLMQVVMREKAGILLVT